LGATEEAAEKVANGENVVPQRLKPV